MPQTASVDDARKRYEDIKRRPVSLDLTRGKPAPPSSISPRG